MNQERINTVVAEIIEGMTAHQKKMVCTTSKDELILLHHGWGTSIRSQYLWQDMELVNATGKAHPDDASMVIIEAVWKRLQGR